MKAVFPVNGLGTRFLPATKAVPKEMLPVVDKPLIQYAVEEAAMVCTRPYGCLRFSREANHRRPFFKDFPTPSIRWKSRSRQKKTGTRRSSQRSRRNVVFPMRNPSSRSMGFVSSGRTGLRPHALPIRRPCWSYVSKATRRNRSHASCNASLPRCFASPRL